ncbi:forkhead box protein N2-like [Acipenser oxyrinchus oxyrinchus]|uniref:Forkhead box protein N2-like n=1 Tax=Acipenser oxyrinchus oxyrinchus TaxID=40147 RepID=A0AAD8FV26_ACIOX|nr:forkhead box protein N2-like [Acipenser oxyrinchus oxyrinchus]
MDPEAASQEPPLPPLSPLPQHRGAPASSLGDEELTSLNWLHENTNLLQELRLGGDGEQPPSLNTLLRGALTDCQGSPRIQLPPGAGEPRSDPSSASSCSKPPYSFSSLIFMAIDGSPSQCLPVKDIYDWILLTFPYFQKAPGGWKNSVRHNLSLSKCFRKMRKDKSKNMGKGSLWSVDPEYRPALLEAVRKTSSCTGTLQIRTNSSPSVAALYTEEPGDYPGSDPQTPSLVAVSPDAPCLWGSNPLPSDPSEDHNYSIYKMAACLAAGGVFQVDVGVSGAGGEGLEELVAIEYCEPEEEGEGCVKDPLADSGYIEYFVFEAEGGASVDLRVLQPDPDLQEAAGSLLNLAGLNYSH